MPSAGTGLDRRSHKPIVLVGFMAAGKSRIGRRLAERLGLRFVDSDRLIENEFGCSITDLFRERGEPEFRLAESRLIRRLLDAEEQVVAVGGGAFVDERNRNALNRGGRTVWLDTPFEVVLPRLLGSNTRPLASQMPESDLRALWDQRRGAYQAAQIRIDTSDADEEQIVDRIVAALG